jgi:hypothetical protein
MNTKTKTKTVGASAPKKETLFSINVVESGIRIRYVNNAPQQEQEVGRVRAD